MGTHVTPARGDRTWRAAGPPLVGWQQLAVIGCVYAIYLGVRELARLGGHSRALDNADVVIRAERSLGVLWEPGLQSRILDHGWLVDTIDVFYLLAHWPLIAVVAIWLYRRVPDGFRLLRNALYVSGALAFVVFAAFPVSPPRFSLAGVADTVVARQGAIHDLLQPAGMMNEFAAMPSLHFGWNLLVCLALVRFARGRLARTAGVVIPPLMAFAVVATANHFVLDVVAGVAVAIVGWVVAGRTTGRTRYVGPPV
jgi:PAP2 superfamily